MITKGRKIDMIASSRAGEYKLTDHDKLATLRLESSLIQVAMVRTP